MELLREKKNKYILGLATIGIAVMGALIFMSVAGVKSSDSFYSGGVKIKSVSSSFENENSFKIVAQDKIVVLESENRKIKKDLVRYQKKEEDLEGKIKDINEILTSLEKRFGKSQIIQQKQAQTRAVPVQKTRKSSAPSSPRNPSPADYSYQSNNKFDPNSDFISSNNGTKNLNRANANNKIGLTQSSGIDSKVFYTSDEKDQRDPKHYLSLGSYATATLLSSVDVGVGVSSQSEPRPCLIRVGSKAFGAAFKEDISKKYKTDIRGAMLTCEARGDLSSERGYIRLLDMALEGTDGKIVELQVSGYVSSFGKAGIRGEVIERETDKVWWATLTGMFSSLGSGMEQRYQNNTTISGSVATTQQNTNDILRSGLGSGVAKALDRVSQYYIEKMEQIQPIVSLPQGLEIEVIFTQGTYIDGRKSFRKKSNNNDSSNNNKTSSTNF